MTNNYKDKIIKQYMSSRGIDDFDPRDKKQIYYFNLWLHEMKEVGKNYRKFVDSTLRDKNWLGDMESIYENYHSAEIGKGYIDTLVNKGSHTYTITQYVKNMYGNCINAIFMPNKGEPLLRKGSNRINLPESVVNLITHNPYDIDGIAKWGKIHRLENSNIVVGFFGHKDDFDRQIKMNQLEEIKIAMRSNFDVNKYEDEYNYYGVITPKEKVKEIVRK